ncbi:MAG: RsmE family RNA methyltransferase [Acutalibacteraceae bacterium]|nr:RsmE family RNA methyltransferase [Acutalibacteraceae bacterium]
MPRFFEKVTSDNVIITGENADHIKKSLRMKTGERITLCDNSTDYECEITHIADEVHCKVISKGDNKTEPTVDVTLFQCVPKGDKLESVIQKSIELGVGKIVPVLSSRCVSRPDKKSAEKKRVRYQKIAESACKQSGRGKIIEVGEMITFAQAVSQIPDFDKTLFFYEGGGESLNGCVDENTKTVAVFIGSEGGFEIEEVEKAKNAGAGIYTLGPRILRTETAPLAALTAIMLNSNNM